MIVKLYALHLKNMAFTNPRRPLWTIQGKFTPYPNEQVLIPNKSKIDKKHQKPYPLPSIEEVKQEFKKALTPTFEGRVQDLKQKQIEELKPINTEKHKMVMAHEHNHLKKSRCKTTRK